MAFVPAIVGAVGSVATAVAPIVGVAAAASQLFGGKQKTPSMPEPPALPQAPKPEEAEDRAAELAKRRRASMSKSVYTSPLGTSGQASVARKTLLGQ